MPSEADEQSLPRPSGRLSLVTIWFQYPRHKLQSLRTAAAKRGQSVAELCRKAVERHLAELAEIADSDAS